MLNGEPVKRIIAIVMLMILNQQVYLSSEYKIDSDAESHHALVISGGISMGAYQAGYNWALMKYYLHRRDKTKFVSFAGTSAGSINALHSALTWCMKNPNNSDNTLSNNLFYKTWTSVTLDKLLPRNGGYEKNDGYFARSAFKQTIQDAKEIIKKEIFLPECNVPLGFAVTMEKPITTYDQQTKIPIENSRFFVPLILKVDENGIAHFLKNDNVSFSGATPLILPLDEEGYIPLARDLSDTNDTVVDVVLASSAFPVAFGPKALIHCVDTNRTECSTSFFVDGGVFDRIPLTLGRELISEQNKKIKTIFNFINPDRMRDSKESVIESMDKLCQREWTNLDLVAWLGSAINTARSQPILQEIEKGFGKDGHDIHASTRKHPIVGSTLKAFGAFFNDNFEKYDYYVGVYDAIENLARYNTQNDEKYTKRLRDIFEEITDDRNVSSVKDEAGMYIITMLANQELKDKNLTQWPKFECEKKKENNEPSCDDYEKL